MVCTQVVIIFVMMMGRMRGLPTRTDIGVDFSFRSLKLALAASEGSIPNYLLDYDDDLPQAFRPTQHVVSAAVSMCMYVSLYVVESLFFVLCSSLLHNLFLVVYSTTHSPFQ
jgi:hypothetical protein